MLCFSVSVASSSKARSRRTTYRYLFHHDNALVMTGGIIMSLLTLFMHRGNIVRLVKGEERKTNLLKKKGSVQ